MAACEALAVGELRGVTADEFRMKEPPRKPLEWNELGEPGADGKGLELKDLPSFVNGLDWVGGRTKADILGEKSALEIAGKYGELPGLLRGSNKGEDCEG